jgi:respiratory-subunit NADH dehydrogenase subunit/transcriptional regulator
MTTVAVSSSHAPQLRLPRLLAGVSCYQPAGLAEHEQMYGPIPLPGHGARSARARPERLFDVVDRSGLTGRGGADFPTGRKMRSVMASRGRAVVVANGAEGEPASCKDRLLLTRVPHLVLDGIVLAAHAVKADEAYLVVHGQEVDLLADLLRYLALHAGQVVTRRDLLTHVWRMPYGGADKTVDVHVSWLRRKLGETAQQPRYLHTVRGVGIKLSAP